jgi:hypothetical protein
MDSELNIEELQQVLRAMRVLVPASTQEQVQALVAAQQQIQISGFLEAVWGIVRLQKEHGIGFSQLMDTCRDLLKRKTALEAEIVSLQDQLVEAKQAYQKTEIDLTTATNQLKAVQKEIHKEEKHLAMFLGEAVGKKEQIKNDLDQWYQEAGVTKEDIIVVKNLKVEVSKSGFKLETMVELVKEFAPYADAKERLAAALLSTQSLSELIVSQEKLSSEQKKATTLTLNQLASQKTPLESEIKQLKASQHCLEINLSQLRSDVKEEQELRQFYMRFHFLSPLLEAVVNWKEVVFLRCDNPFCEPFAGVNHFWTEKAAAKCPHCGLGLLKYDVDLYKRVGLTPDTVKLKLGV